MAHATPMHASCTLTSYWGAQCSMGQNKILKLFLFLKYFFGIFKPILVQIWEFFWKKYFIIPAICPHVCIFGMGQTWRYIFLVFIFHIVFVCIKLAAIWFLLVRVVTFYLEHSSFDIIQVLSVEKCTIYKENVVYLSEWYYFQYSFFTLVHLLSTCYIKRNR